MYVLVKLRLPWSFPKTDLRGTRVAHLVGHLTLGFSLDHELVVLRLNPVSGSVLSVEST